GQRLLHDLLQPLGRFRLARALALLQVPGARRRLQRLLQHLFGAFHHLFFASSQTLAKRSSDCFCADCASSSAPPFSSSLCSMAFSVLLRVDSPLPISP